MAKRGTNKRKRSKAVRREQIQKRILTAGLAGVLVLAVIIGVFFLNGCNSYASDVNTIYLLKDGTVVSNTIESFDESLYSKDALKTYIKESIDTYNSKNEAAVKQKSLKVKDAAAVLLMEYASADVFEDFEGTEFFTGTIAEALEAGYTFEGNFVKVTEGKPVSCTAEDFLNGDYQVVILKSNVTVSLEDADICYVSSENTESAKDGVVVIKNGASLFASTEVMETEAVTETTEAEEVITDDELLLGEEETIVFDFGEEENESQYSNVYTYIIYK